VEEGTEAWKKKNMAKVNYSFMFIVSNMGQDKLLEILLRQYSECFSDRRTQVTMVWQIPSITMAINTFIGILYLGYAKENAVARLLILAAAVAFTFVALVALIKHRFFELARTRDVIWIQNELKKIESDIREIKWRSEDIICDKKGYPDVPRHFISRISAYNCLRNMMFAMLIVLVSLLLWELILIL